ncbi:MAG: M28 family metallopeptidase [Bryobacteraceae bacterium]
MKRILLVLALSLFSCSRSSGPNLKPALDGITADGLLGHIKVLASDEFEGRLPGTRGEELTVRYLTDQFRKRGLEPGNPDGSYVQKVPLLGITSQTSIDIRVGGKALAVTPREDIVALSNRFEAEVKVENTPVVFAGYGVTAPEYGWDDFKGVDVKGKTILTLINDPAIPDAENPTRLDSKMFKGRAMTYYGRWTYKFEKASELGAAAVLIIHETGPAGYPFAVVSASWGRENFEVRRGDGNAGRVPVEGWITYDKANELFRMAGKDLASLQQAALRKDFRPVELTARASFRVNNRMRPVDSRNVIARLPGSDPALRDEVVIYTAHWDHLGKDETLKGDQIFNGAIDNASGVASLLELAHAFTRVKPRPRRTLLFLALTAEEQGLLGARYYAANPLYPLSKTLADINMDGVNQWGRTSDYVIIGLGNTTLDELFAEEAGTQRRAVVADAEPEKGFFYRSDHFEFAKAGVPASNTDSGIDFIGKAKDFGQRQRDAYTANDYHKVTDEVKPDWDLSGAVEDTQLLFRVGYRVAQDERWPEWKPGTEFREKREAMLKRR